jgi:hypothetical protein
MGDVRTAALHETSGRLRGPGVLEVHVTELGGVEEGEKVPEALSLPECGVR